jgi:hypothetical protein
VGARCLGIVPRPPAPVKQYEQVRNFLETAFHYSRRLPLPSYLDFVHDRTRPYTGNLRRCGGGRVTTSLTHGLHGGCKERRLLLAGQVKDLAILRPTPTPTPTPTAAVDGSQRAHHPSTVNNCLLNSRSLLSSLSPRPKFNTLFNYGDKPIISEVDPHCRAIVLTPVDNGHTQS